MWTINLHGNTDEQPPEVAAELEHKLVEVFHELAGHLVPDGHQGVAATMTGDHVGTVNLIDPGEAVAGTPDAEVGVKADGTFQPAPTGPPPTFADESSPQGA